MTNFSMQETQRILVKCKNSLYCNQPYVKEACRQLFWALDEIVNLRRQVTELERKVVESNHRNLDLQYIVDSDTKTIAELKAALTKYVIDDLSDERLSNRMADGGYDSRTDADLEKEAKDQLANEYPEIFAGNKRLQEIERFYQSSRELGDRKKYKT